MAVAEVSIRESNLLRKTERSKASRTNVFERPAESFSRSFVRFQSFKTDLDPGAWIVPQVFEVRSRIPKDHDCRTNAPKYFCCSCFERSFGLERFVRSKN